MREVKSDPLVLGEATGVPEWLGAMPGRIDAIFDFNLAYYVRPALARGRMDAARFAGWLDEHDSAYPGLVLATLLDNHPDMNRFLGMAGGSTDRLKLAATLLLTLPGMPVIYYGTEVGLSQRHDSVIQKSRGAPSHAFGATDQDEDLLAHFQLLGRMRHESLALRRGTRRTVLADSEVFAYERSAGDETVLVALNFSEQRQTRYLQDEPSEIRARTAGVSDHADRHARRARDLRRRRRWHDQGMISRSKLAGTELEFYPLSALPKAGVPDPSGLPMTVKVLLEGLVRLAEAGTTSEENVKSLATWPTPSRDAELPFLPRASSCRTSPACPPSSTWPRCDRR